MKTLRLILAVLTELCCVCEVVVHAQSIDYHHVEVRSCALGGDPMVVMTYGIVSNHLDYLVLEIGHGQMDSHLKGPLRIGTNGPAFGEQILHLGAVDIRLPSTKQLFIVEGQKCYLEPLSISLESLEARLKVHAVALSEELRLRAHKEVDRW